MRIPVGIYALLIAASIVNGVAADANLNGYFRGKSASELARIPEFGNMPLLARSLLLDRLDPAFVKLPEREQQEILFANPSGKRQPEYFVWVAGESGTDRWASNGTEFASFNLPGGLRVVCAHVPWDKYSSLLLQFTNSSASNRFDVDPSLISIVEVSPEIKYLQPVSARDITKRFERGAKWANFADQFGANMATVEESTVTNGRVSATARGPAGTVYADGTYSEQTTTSSPDYQRQQQARMDSRRRIAEARQRGQNLADRTIKANTLFPGDQIVGFVDFERSKTFRSGVIRILIAGMSIEFPLGTRPAP